MRLALLLAAAALLASACAPMQPRPAGGTAAQAAWQTRQDALNQVGGFALQGRINDAHLARTADMSWRQYRDGRFELQLNGPFGIGAVSIVGDAQQVVVRSKDGATAMPDPQAWMQAQLGWSLPIDDLRAWALGMPAPGPYETLSLDAMGHALDLSQNGWDIHYDSYQAVGGLQLPRKLQAESGDTRLRLVIDRWLALDTTTNE